MYRVFHKYCPKKGFVQFNETISLDNKIPNCYFSFMGKSALFFKPGAIPPLGGIRILCAHVDSPRLDLKQNPLFCADNLAYLDTQYYGGIKKYQWLGIPLAIHGVIVKKDGTVVRIAIGEESEDPVLGITDLLIHLSREQLEKRAGTFVDGDQLNLLVGSIPPIIPMRKRENALL